MNSDKYVLMACVLIESIKKYMTIDVDYICLYNNLSDNAIKLLKNHYTYIKEVSKIEYDTYKPQNRFTSQYTWLNSCYTKFHVFELINYQKILFTDVDMFCFGNLSNLFDLPTPAGVLISQQKAGYQSGIPITKQLLQDALQYGYGISASCFLISPQKGDFENIIKCLYSFTLNKKFQMEPKQFDINSNIRINAGPDEQLLAYYYFQKSDIFTQWTNISRQFSCVSWLKNKFENGKFNFISLPDNYYFNTQENGISKEQLEKIKISIDFENKIENSSNNERKIFLVHYVTGKPWDPDKQTGLMWPDCKLWFDAIQESQGDILEFSKEIFGDWQNTFKFMSQNEADKIYEKDQQKQQYKKKQWQKFDSKTNQTKYDNQQYYQQKQQKFQQNKQYR